MNDSPFISVMILCYNYSSLLKKALEACAKQTFRDFEIVMINNGSTDDTEKVFFDFKEANPDILTQYVFVSPNQGPTHGWNVGLDYAKGKYVLFNDADDWMEPNCLEELAKAAKESHADRIVGEYNEVLSNGNIHRIRKIVAHSASIPPTTLQGTAFRKAIIDDHSISFPENILIPYDYSFLYSFINVERTEPFFIRKVIYNYYFNPNSICQKYQQSGSYNILLDDQYYVFVDVSLNAINNAKSKSIKHQIEYLCIRNLYATIFHAYSIFSRKDAEKFYDALHKKIVSVIPNYKKNPLIFPIRNGYEFAGSLAVWMLIKAESLRIIKPFCRILSSISSKKYYRKTIEE